MDGLGWVLVLVSSVGFGWVHKLVGWMKKNGPTSIFDTSHRRQVILTKRHLWY